VPVALTVPKELELSGWEESLEESQVETYLAENADFSY
jgi:hypothetical protein